MNINQVPTRGFGPQASIGGIITAGFSSSNLLPNPGNHFMAALKQAIKRSLQRSVKK